MNVYMDSELAEVLSIACRGLVDIEKKMDAVRSVDLNQEERPAVHEARTAGMILYASGEPYAIVRMEDVWSEADLLDGEGKKVAEKVATILANIGQYRLDDAGNIVKR